MTLEEALELGQFYCRNLANHKQGPDAADTLARWKPFIIAAQANPVALEYALEALEEQASDSLGYRLKSRWVDRCMRAAASINAMLTAYRAAVSQESK